MLIYIKSLLYSTLLILCFSKKAYFDLVKLNTTGALCLDGSPAAYYISRDGDPSKIFLQFEGGGWCGSQDLSTAIQSCYVRSKTYWGTTKDLRAQEDFSGEGSLSNNQENNFKNWKRVLLLYCDGSGHQGTRQQPIKYKDAQLYFRGHNITVDQLDRLQSSIGLFSKATHVVVSGASAGGLAVFLWTNYIAQKVKVGKIWALPDSGIFYDSYNVNLSRPAYKQTLANVMKISNIQIDPPTPQCLKQFPNAKENCMFAQNLFRHIKVPMLIIQSLYDSWSIPNILGIHCINNDSSLQQCTVQERKSIEAYHQNLSRVITQSGNNHANGHWAIACAQHVYSRNQAYHSKQFRVPQHSANYLSTVVEDWLEQKGSNHKYMDTEWPENKPCSGTTVTLRSQ